MRAGHGGAARRNATRHHWPLTRQGSRATSGPEEYLEVPAAAGSAAGGLVQDIRSESDPSHAESLIA